MPGTVQRLERDNIGDMEQRRMQCRRQNNHRHRPNRTEGHHAGRPDARFEADPIQRVEKARHDNRNDQHLVVGQVRRKGFQIACCHQQIDGDDRNPAAPVAPIGSRADNRPFAKGFMRVNRSAAAFVGKHGRHFGNHQALDNADADNQGPNEDRGRAKVAGNRAERRSDKQSPAERDDKGGLPGDGPLERFRFGNSSRRKSGNTHSVSPSRLKGADQRIDTSPRQCGEGKLKRSRHRQKEISNENARESLPPNFSESPHSRRVQFGFQRPKRLRRNAARPARRGPRSAPGLPGDTAVRPADGGL